MTKPLFVANWKMHGSPEVLGEWLAPLGGGACRAVACPPFPLLGEARAVLGDSDGDGDGDGGCELGAQDCHFSEEGAFTGSVSPRLLARMGCRWVILGHSEWRRDFGDGDGGGDAAVIRAKAEAAIAAGLNPILCLGETAEVRGSYSREVVIDALRDELAQMVPSDLGSCELAVAYEPVWAIGTGESASPVDVAEVFAVFGEFLGRGGGVSFLYGGSVSAGNAVSFLTEGGADGLLVGGLSMRPVDLGRIFADIGALA
ncbi:MAG: triose-phosphate isomerase [Alphaproteobacteria bacterium]|nr:triose-phosphate isomerase [Alphaproteobacteria bacterium]MDA8005193.1 triose-phosphate isomerase [Alphaproteobacteria bacterium]MDA8012823.1 triose-phosphate isomerase [Alphaproteobacteria bacterium]